MGEMGVLEEIVIPEHKYGSHLLSLTNFQATDCLILGVIGGLRGALEVLLGGNWVFLEHFKNENK